MILHVSKSPSSNEVEHISFPADVAKVRYAMIGLEEFGGWAPAYIVGGEGPAEALTSYISRDDLYSEEPRSFYDAGCIAMDIDDYELVDSNEGEYGRETLRKAGADDEILDMLDGFTDFDALGRSEMETDGVRESSFGSVRRLSAPWPRQEPDMGPVIEGFA